MMGLPFDDPTVHTAEFYIDTITRVDDARRPVRLGVHEGRLGHDRSAHLLRDRGRAPEDPAARGAALAAHARHGLARRGAVHGGHRGRRGWRGPVGAADGLGHRAARRPVAVARAEGHRLRARHRRQPDGRAREDAERGAGGVRLRPDDDDRRRARGGLPDAGRRHRPQRPHDEGGRHPRPVQRGARRVPGRGEGGRRVDERHAGQPAVLAAGVLQRAARPLEEDRGRVRPCRARLLRPAAAAARPRGGRRSPRSS